MDASMSYKNNSWSKTISSLDKKSSIAVFYPLNFDSKFS
jgi:hypothetical protein